MTPKNIRRISSSISVFQDEDYIRLSVLCPPVTHESCNHPLRFDEAFELHRYLSKYLEEFYSKKG